jgi:hypothetical protein
MGVGAVDVDERSIVEERELGAAGGTTSSPKFEPHRVSPEGRWIAVWWTARFVDRLMRVAPPELQQAGLSQLPDIIGPQASTVSGSHYQRF